ncbi:uncharacterized protein LOC110443846 isoform X2 [Mizuhopecten yessoensis]|uniref:uncharacterized protein LOC110443846 isoform X2 n=1 Tax=Mizuhopecten yessoensis TaxID=6573 RepID=UPI000B45B88B|nr:uncharacterized protein LOC110443846 isoform X2 [Mizuhopecten yessoensis]
MYFFALHDSFLGRIATRVLFWVMSRFRYSDVKIDFYGIPIINDNLKIDFSKIPYYPVTPVFLYLRLSSVERYLSPRQDVFKALLRYLQGLSKWPRGSRTISKQRIVGDDIKLRMGPSIACLLAIMVMAATTLPTTGRPILKHVLVQCGDSSCNIMKEYCYQQQCFPCNEAVCNTPGFDGGMLAQCYFYCEATECVHAVKKEKTGMRMEIYQFLLIILGTFSLGAVAVMLFMWYRNRQTTTNNKDRRAFPVSPPQDKYSGNTNPKEKVKMLVSNM